MNQHLLREASDAALYRQQRDEAVRALQAFIDLEDDTAAGLYIDPPAEEDLERALANARVLLAKVSHD